MRICGACGAAENPNGRLKFFDATGYEALCADCRESVGEPLPLPTGDISGLEEYVVIKCPDCRGSGRGPVAGPCNSCVRYGYVRVAMNALPVYIMKSKPELLTEG